MKLFSLAFRNLLRNRRRSVTTLIAMVVGIATVLLFGGYSRNITYSLQTGYVLRSGHLQVQRKGYFLYGMGNPAAYGIPRYQRIIDLVKHDPALAPMVAVVTPTLSLNGIASNPAKEVSHTVFGTGFIVNDRNRMREWNDYGLRFATAQSPLTATAMDSAIIGAGVARLLQLCEPLHVTECAPAEPVGPIAGERAPDDIVALAGQEQRPSSAADEARIDVLAANVHGAPNVASLHVIKAEPQAFKEFDDTYLGMHLEQAQRLLYGAETPQVTAVTLQLVHTSQMGAARAGLQQLLDTTLASEPLEIQDFETLNPFYGQAVKMFGAIFGFMAVLIGAIVLFTVSNTMSMAVVERTTEIGTLRAIGLRRSGIRRMFACEALLLGAMGGASGLVVALAAAWLVNHSGLTWLPPGQVEPLPLTVRLWGETQLMLGTAAGLVLVSVLSAWWPARRAGRMVIVDALRHV